MKLTIKRPQDKSKLYSLYHITQKSDIDVFRHDKPMTLLILGSSLMGKSTLLMYLYEKYFAGPDHIVTLFTNSSHIEHYRNHKYLIIRKGFCFYDCDTMESQKYVNEKTKNKYKFVNLFDDVINTTHKETLQKMFLYYRNSGLSTIVSTQYKNLVEPAIRANAQSIVFFGFNDEKVIRFVIEEFLDSYFTAILEANEIKPSYQNKVVLYQTATQDHGCIYLVSHERRIEFIKIKPNEIN